MISASVVGALIGLVFGIVDFIVLGYVVHQRRRRRPGEPQGSQFALNAARISQLLLFPVVGWFAGPVVASNLGG